MPLVLVLLVLLLVLVLLVLHVVLTAVMLVAPWRVRMLVQVLVLLVLLLCVPAFPELQTPAPAQPWHWPRTDSKARGALAARAVLTLCPCSPKLNGPWTLTPRCRSSSSCHRYALGSTQCLWPYSN